MAAALVDVLDALPRGVRFSLGLIIIVSAWPVILPENSIPAGKLVILPIWVISLKNLVKVDVVFETSIGSTVTNLMRQL